MPGISNIFFFISLGVKKNLIMKKILKRSKFKRKLSLSFEKKKKIYKSLVVNDNFIKTIRWNADLNIFKRSLSFIQLNNRCIITGRKNIYNCYYKLSRIMFLKYARKGVISNLIKSSW